MSRWRYDDKINRLDTSAINEGTFVRDRMVCNSRANEMKKFSVRDINYFSGPRRTNECFSQAGGKEILSAGNHFLSFGSLR